MRKFKQNSYYWVRRNPIHSGEGRSEYPDWQPMLFDKGRFYTQGVSTSYAPDELAEIGEIIERRPKRRRRQGWAPMTFWRGRYKPELDIYFARSDAADNSDGPPIRVEMSWDAEELRKAREKYYRRNR